MHLGLAGADPASVKVELDVGVQGQERHRAGGVRELLGDHQRGQAHAERIVVVAGVPDGDLLGALVTIRRRREPEEEIGPFQRLRQGLVVVRPRIGALSLVEIVAPGMDEAVDVVEPIERVPPELREALVNPLSFVRFGVVDELGRLLSSGDKSQVIAARLALERLVAIAPSLAIDLGPEAIAHRDAHLRHLGARALVLKADPQAIRMLGPRLVKEKVRCRASCFCGSIRESSPLAPLAGRGAGGEGFSDRH